MRVIVVVKQSLRGLGDDYKIIKSIFESYGFEVIRKKNSSFLWLKNIFFKQYDICIVLERPSLRWLLGGGYRIYQPNQEWLKEKKLWISRRYDLVWCKTRESYLQLKKFNSSCNAEIIGFISNNPIHNIDISKANKEFLHIVGGSKAKGTVKLIQAWQYNPNWPILHIVSKRDFGEINEPNIKFYFGHLEENKLEKLRLNCIFHIQPSEVEGWGHSPRISCKMGAINLITNAPPFDEFFTKEFSFLIDSYEYKKQRLGRCFTYKISALENEVNNALKLSISEIKTLSKISQKQIKKNETNFFKTFETSFQKILKKHDSKS